MPSRKMKAKGAARKRARGCKALRTSTASNSTSNRKPEKAKRTRSSGRYKAADMLCWEYTGPFDELAAQNHEYGFPEEVARVTKQSGKWPATTAAKAHKVIDGGKDVTSTEGTGIVHTAPGCGAIDYQWGKQNGLPPVAPIGDDGIFVDGFGPLDGQECSRSNDRGRCLRATQGERRPLRNREVRPPLPTLLAVQDRAAVPARG